ncbi:metallophosphoesterase family protein [Leptospira sp. GIMC2001]|uniref:metallophosphoesterase family protein n=1 Tax=Leptospira sp. GIMC2001 TaxID=1513297 RepID=UPI00234BAD1C|nr:metallophosphoesterase family protein [Leptospira sp. GIMC2001]WCL51226.1 metallophosphoesterase family protein [Leptospira sp. GIMC2001]
MKLGVISDIHGNHLALQAVLNSAKSKGVEKLLVAGDLIGYYFWAKEVINLLKDWDCLIVRGNHEEMLAKAIQNPEYLIEVDKKYGKGIRYAIETLADTEIDFLISLPHPLEVSFDDLSILLCHGSPWDLDKYIYPDADLAIFDQFDLNKFDIVIVGHTHYPMVKNIKNSILLNPGSVGQSRNRIPGAHWAILETENNAIEHFVEKYDDSYIITKAEEIEPNLPYLTQVLQRQ